MKKKLIIILFAVLIIIGWIAVKYYSRTTAYQPEAISVQASTVKEATLPLDVHAIGTLVARRVEITPELAGHVEKQLFQDGAYVKKGELLIQLDDAVYKAKYASAKAKYIFSKNNFRRMALLAKKGIIAKQAIDQAESNLKEKRADVQENEVIMKRMRLTAPFAGMVGKSNVNPGDYVTVGQPLVTLTDTKHLRVEYDLPEVYLPLLKHGQIVKLTADAYPGKVFLGRLTFISPTINTSNRSISLYAEVPNEKNLLAAGMFMNVKQDLGKEKRVLLIPARSLVPMAEGEQIYKIVDKKAYASTVKIGKRIGDNVQILQGVASGDVVITDGQLKLKNGVPVKLKT